MMHPQPLLVSCLLHKLKMWYFVLAFEHTFLGTIGSKSNNYLTTWNCSIQLDSLPVRRQTNLNR
jgi:hypothetical protein